MTLWSSITIVYEKSETEKDCTVFYGDIEEEISLNAPTPLVKSVDLRMMFISDHAGDKTTRHPCTSFMIIVNLALVKWLSKKQRTVESAVFGAKFAVIKHGVGKL